MKYSFNKSDFDIKMERNDDFFRLVAYKDKEAKAFVTFVVDQNIDNKIWIFRMGKMDENDNSSLQALLSSVEYFALRNNIVNVEGKIDSFNIEQKKLYEENGYFMSEDTNETHYYFSKNLDMEIVNKQSKKIIDNKSVDDDEIVLFH